MLSSEEQIIYKIWQDNQLGNPENQVEAQKLSKPYSTHSILMPPPNLTGNLHTGHTFQHFLMDTLSRINRQKGIVNLWFPGMDHAGIQLEGVIDKLIKKGEFDKEICLFLNNLTNEDDIEKSKKIKEILNNSNSEENRENLPTEIKKFNSDFWLELAWSKVNLWRDNQKKLGSLIGDTPDYSRQLFTLDDDSNKMVNLAFEKYWEDGLIYKSSYLINWSVGLQTALSDVSGDIEYQKRIDPLVTFQYQIKEIRIRNLKLETPDFQSFLHDYLMPLNLWPRLNLSTVRPETKFTDLALAMHPDKFNDYFSLDLFDKQKAGFDLEKANVFLEAIKNYQVEVFYHLPPLESESVKLIFSDKVDPTFGTGIVKITPGHDLFDYNLYQEFVNKGILEAGKIQICIDKNGKLNDYCKEFSGLKVEKARPLIIKKLLETGYIPQINNQEKENSIKENNQKEIINQQKILSQSDFENLNIENQYKYLQKLYPNFQIDWNYEHNVTICERSKTIIEPLISEEFFIDYFKEFEYQPMILNNLKEETLKVKKTTLQKLALSSTKEVEFFSADYKDRYLNFFENIHNWCISRDLVWGHKIPVWYNLEINPEKKFFSYQEIKNLYQQKKDLPMIVSDKKPIIKGNWVQEKKILDTWFSSCLWPLSTTKFGNYLTTKTKILLESTSDIKNDEFISDNLKNNYLSEFKYFYPTSEITTAKEIFYIWICRMLLLSKYFTGQVPYKKIVIHPTILDEKGRKMSKSLGNGLDPLEAIQKFSSDDLRLAMLSGMIPNRNMRLGGKLADKIMEKYRNFNTKVNNVAKFLFKNN